MRALEHLTRDQALGVLAEAALSLNYMISDSLQERVVEEAKDILGIAISDTSSEAISKVADYLDEQSDLLVNIREQDALQRLADRGQLPSDLYKVNIVSNVLDVYGKAIELEGQIIALTIAEPQEEQHFSPASTKRVPAMISLFVRTFRTKWPLRDFLVLVAGQRFGTELFVHQSWRIYPVKTDLTNISDPLHLLKRFSEEYGEDVEIDGMKAPFFLMTDSSNPKDLSYTGSKNKSRVIVSRFNLLDNLTGQESSALVASIHIAKYRKTLKEYSVKRQDFLEETQKKLLNVSAVNILPRPEIKEHLASPL